MKVRHALVKVEQYLKANLTKRLRAFTEDTLPVLSGLLRDIILVE
jgi:hypothetical protein